MQTGDLGLKPNFLTFAILLQCHGRQQKLAVDAVKQVLNDVTRAVSVCVILCGFAFASEVTMHVICNFLRFCCDKKKHVKFLSRS